MSISSSSPSNSTFCTGYLVSPPAVQGSYCAMRNCFTNLMIMESCCKAAAGKDAAILPYTIPPNGSHRQGANDYELNAIYCLIGHYSFSQWEKCTSSQGVEAGICAIGVEAYQSGAERDQVGSIGIGMERLACFACSEI